MLLQLGQSCFSMCLCCTDVANWRYWLDFLQQLSCPSAMPAAQTSMEIPSRLQAHIQIGRLQLQTPSSLYKTRHGCSSTGILRGGSVPTIQSSAVTLQQIIFLDPHILSEKQAGFACEHDGLIGIGCPDSIECRGIAAIPNTLRSPL